MIRCQRIHKARRNVRECRSNRKAVRARKAIVRPQVIVNLPYDCGANGRWAIPCYIVACESGFSWTAYNKSGATGPYQLLGKGVTLATPRAIHHAVAARLWNGGAGAKHWSQCL